VHHDVGAERERLLQVRRGERVVDDDAPAAPVRHLRERGDVDDRQRGIGRRLHPDHARLGAPCGLERACVGEVGRGPRDARGLEHLAEQSIGAAVRVGGDDHVIAGRQPAQHRVLGGHAAREREPVLGALERGEAHLERTARGVAGARVLEAQVLPNRRLRERRRQRDRRDHRAGDRVGLLAGVDRLGLEAPPRPRTAARARHRDAPARAARNASTSWRVSTPTG
jgi:hypothetical protein